MKTLFKTLLNNFDVDIMLRDLSLDASVSPERRSLCAASLGLGVDDAFYSVRELRQAVKWVHEGNPGGKLKLAGILSTQCDDYQRNIYYILAGRGVVNMLDDLDWLVVLLRKRGLAASAISRAGLRYKTGQNPYVAEHADGPVVAIDPDFQLGQSWSSENPRPAR